MKQELERHHEENREFAPEGSREHRLHHGASRVLDALKNDDVHFTVVTSVPRPHGADAGETSLQQELHQNPEAVDVIVLMDVMARQRIRNDIERHDMDARVLAPTFLFYLLLDNAIIDKQRFCETIEDMLLSERWTGYQVVQAAWEGIPVDCSEHINTGMLP